MAFDTIYTIPLPECAAGCREKPPITSNKETAFDGGTTDGYYSSGSCTVTLVRHCEHDD